MNAKEIIVPTFIHSFERTNNKVITVTRENGVFLGVNALGLIQLVGGTIRRVTYEISNGELIKINEELASVIPPQGEKVSFIESNLFIDDKGNIKKSSGGN